MRNESERCNICKAWPEEHSEWQRGYCDGIHAQREAAQQTLEHRIRESYQQTVREHTRGMFGSGPC